jgi:Mg-chelatase subunit ChlD
MTSNAASEPAAPNLHIYFVLDRSGSMASMASDVIGGFNSFLASQQSEGNDALMTLVQFDSQDPHEILANAARLNDVPTLNGATFVPRGGTPLYDAMGHTIADATIRIEQRRLAGEPDEEILFVTFTDGQENQSLEYDRARLFELVKKREATGWSFVFLGANQDSYAEGAQIGYTAGNTQNFAPSPAGAQAAFASLAPAVSRRRQAIRQGESYDRADLFQGDKGAEDLLEERST